MSQTTGQNSNQNSGQNSGQKSGQKERPPLEDLISRMRAAAGDAPASLFEGMRPVLDGFFEQFQLVPRKEYDAQLASFEKLEDKVAQLEERIAGLERGD